MNTKDVEDAYLEWYNTGTYNKDEEKFADSINGGSDIQKMAFYGGFMSAYNFLQKQIFNIVKQNKND